MNAREANTHCTSESAIQNGMMSRIHSIARSSSMFSQSRKYPKRTYFVLRRRKCESIIIKKYFNDVQLYVNVDIYV